MEITDAQISSWVSHFLWPLYRILGFFMIAPFFGTRNIPTRIRVAFGVVITFLIAPILPEMPDIESVSLLSTLVIFHQLSIGIALGFVYLVFFQIFVVAGQMIAMQMGLGMASMIDPSNGVSVPTVAQWYLTLVTLIFVAMNGHLVVLEILIESFQTMPVGVTGLSTLTFFEVSKWASWMLSSALSMALPSMGALLLVNLSFGIMARAAPSMNIFSLGFPITMIMGVFVLWLSFTGVLATIQNLMLVLTDMMKSIVNIPL